MKQRDDCIIYTYASAISISFSPDHSSPCSQVVENSPFHGLHQIVMATSLNGWTPYGAMCFELTPGLTTSVTTSLDLGSG